MILPSLNDYILTDPTLAKTFLQLSTLFFPIIITLYLTVAVLQNFFVHYAKEGAYFPPTFNPSQLVGESFIPASVENISRYYSYPCIPCIDSSAPPLESSGFC